nr:MAG TPA: hypothetical protein [Caudoviricetes sp.]
MNRFDRFTAEELMLIKWALYIVIIDFNDNKNGTTCNESEYKIAKSLYESIKEYLKEKKK